MSAVMTQPGRGIDADRLESLLADLEREHEVLLSLAGAQRDAVMHADARAIQRITGETAETLGRIAKTEHTRRSLIKEPDGSTPTLEQIAGSLGGDRAGVLRARAASLRSLMERVREEQEAVRIASEALAAHMKGLIDQVSGKLSHAGTYSQGGAVRPTSQQVVSGVDLVR